MKKLLLVVPLMLLSIIGFSQTPEIGHFKQLSTVRRGDTLDVAWYYKPAAGKDVRTFQVDWQFKKTLLTYLSTTVDGSVSGKSPISNYQSWDNYKYGSYSNGTYSYVSNTDWTVARNYLILSNGTQISSNGYVIHNKYLINDVQSNYASDTIQLNWSRLFKVDGTSIGDNVANLSYNKMAIKLLGNLTISGKVSFPSTITTGLLPTIYCYENSTGNLVSQTVPTIDGNYTLNNVDEYTKYKIEVRFPQDSLAKIRDYAVTISDALKSYNEYSKTDVNQTKSKLYLKHGLSYLIGDINLNKELDGGDPFGIYASISGLKPISTSKLINVFHKSEYDSLVLGTNQWTDWVNYSDKGVYIYDSVGTSNITVDIKYFVLGDVDRTYSSPVYDINNNEVFGAIYKGKYDITIPDSYTTGESMYVPFNVSTNGDNSNGIQFEMNYDVTKVKFEEIVSNIQGPWLQYVTHDETNGIIRFGGMNNQKDGSLQGVVTPFKLKFSSVVPTEDISTYVSVRKLMDASDDNGDHFNIVLASDRVLLQYRASKVVLGDITEPTSTIYPNPNNGIFELVLNLPNNTKMNASIYDYNGKKLIDLGNFESFENVEKFSKTIDVQSFSKGTYLVVLSNNNKIITKPFIKA